MPRVLLLGGLDPSGGAGITLDATVAARFGVEPLPIAVALTVQGRRGFVRSQPVPASLLRAQLGAVLDDGAIDAAKLGFVGDAGALAGIGELLLLLDERVPLVVDPVLSATAGGLDAPDGLAGAYREHVVPRAALLTPNVPELAALAGGDAGALLRAGAAAVLVKGGHGDGPDAIDELFAAGAVHRLARPRRDVGPVRGTGCALASAIACHLASGLDVVAACRRAGDWLNGVLARVRPRPDGLPGLLPLGGEP